MSCRTLHSEKGPTSHRDSEVASEPSDKGSLVHNLSEDCRSSNVPDVTVNPDSSVLVVDWDGPEDQSNPKK